MLQATQDIVPNWLEATPDPTVFIGKRCAPFKVEMVIRGYLSGHAAREYKADKRELCGVAMPEGMIENDRFPSPIITPATKAEEGHDEDISREEIIRQGIVAEADYVVLEKYTPALFERGSQLPQKKDWFWWTQNMNLEKRLMVQLFWLTRFTPQTPRVIFMLKAMKLAKKRGGSKQLSKEFVRQWLISNGFKAWRTKVPEMSEEYIETVSNRYIELYENITREGFVKAD